MKKKLKLKIKTKANLQNFIVIAAFMIILGIISYPVIAQKQGLLAEPSRDVHLQMKDSSKKKVESCTNDGLVPSIFSEN